jgi:hypothetical protein
MSAADITRPPQLILAERWIQAAGMTTRWGTANGPAGTIAALEIQRGPLALGAFSPPSQSEETAYIVLRLSAPIPAAVRATVSRLSEDAQRHLTESVFAALQMNLRTGWSLQPPTAQSAAQIESITLEQLLHLDDRDPSSYNRLLDGVQELVTGILAVGRRFALQVQVTQSRPSTGTNPTSGMFG